MPGHRCKATQCDSLRVPRETRRSVAGQGQGSAAGARARTGATMMGDTFPSSVLVGLLSAGACARPRGAQAALRAACGFGSVLRPNLHSRRGRGYGAPTLAFLRAACSSGAPQMMASAVATPPVRCTCPTCSWATSACARRVRLVREEGRGVSG